MCNTQIKHSQHTENTPCAQHQRKGQFCAGKQYLNTYKTHSDASWTPICWAWGGNRFFVRPLIDPRKIGFIIHESIFTGDPLHSRALAHSRAPLFTQPCPHCSHSRAPGEQWTRLCVFTLQGCVQAARLCRGSPVILVPWFVSEESTRCLSAARLTRDRGACETIETRENLGPF